MLSCTEKPPVVDKTIDEAKAMVAKNPIEGGWYTIHGEYSGNIRTDAAAFQFKLFGKDQFSYLWKGEDGKWASGASGSYRIEGNKYIETFEFTSGGGPVAGATAEWDYRISGDTLFMSGPTKIMQGGKEAPEIATYNSMKEIRVRSIK